jgi:hypothetical protein
MWNTDIRQPIARKNTGGGDMITIAITIKAENEQVGRGGLCAVAPFI